MAFIDEVFGATLCGTVVASWVFGLLCVLCYQYYVNYPEDPLSTKILVGTLWALQLVTTVTDLRMLYHYLITNFGNEEALLSATWEWSYFLAAESVTASLVQIYYARRILILTNSYILSGFAVLLSLVSLGFGTATAGASAHLKVFARFIPLTWVAVTWLSCTLACDLVVTAIQVWYLRRHRTGVRGTERILNKLIFYIISTGVLTSILAVLEVSTFAALGWNFTHDFVSFPNGGVYVLSLLSNLDVRRKVRSMKTDPSTTGGLSNVNSEFDLGDMRFKTGTTITITRARAAEAEGWENGEETLKSVTEARGPLDKEFV